MCIRDSFKESVQKALGSLEIGLDGFDLNEEINMQDLKKKLIERTPQKILFVAEAFRRDLKLDEIYEMTKIDKWFLEQIQELVIVETQIKNEDVLNNKVKLQYIKSIGFSDKKIAKILKIKSNEVRSARNKFKIHPIYKKIDTCAGEFESKTPVSYTHLTLPTKRIV